MDGLKKTAREAVAPVGCKQVRWRVDPLRMVETLLPDCVQSQHGDHAMDRRGKTWKTDQRTAFRFCNAYAFKPNLPLGELAVPPAALP